MHTYVCLYVCIFKEWRSQESWRGRSDVNAALIYKAVKNSYYYRAINLCTWVLIIMNNYLL